MHRSAPVPNFFDPLRFCRPRVELQDDRSALIAEAAYLRAQSRGFAVGHELDDWLAAEAELYGVPR